MLANIELDFHLYETTFAFLIEDAIHHHHHHHKGLEDGAKVSPVKGWSNHGSSSSRRLSDSLVKHWRLSDELGSK